MQTLFRRSVPVLVILSLLSLSACNLSGATATPEVENGITTQLPEVPPPLIPTETITHLVTPGAGAATESSISDTISGDTAHQGVPNEPPGGDMYLYNLYERPFNALTQDIFFPDLDIRSADLGLNSPWMYVTIYLYGLRPETGVLAGHYGIEIDLNIDGRGDWLIMADTPLTTEWSTDGVRAWQDTNVNVGQELVCYADPPQIADSYDLLYFDQGVGDDPDAAWARFVEGTPPAVQIAFKHTMINSDVKFMWGVWTDQGVNQPQWFDYHDHFTYDEAGSPFSYLTEYYPIKAIAELDNTCRWVYGFESVGTEPCLCFGNVPTPTPVLSSLGGYVYKDFNRNGVRDEGDGGFGSLAVTVRQGACPGGAIVASAPTGAWGRYTVTDLMPGTYCVLAPDAGTIVFTPAFYEVTLAPGEFRDELNFGWLP
jgi:hypothetical protein